MTRAPLRWAFALALLACGPSPRVDAGPLDGGAREAGVSQPDAGADRIDASRGDASQLDAGRLDAGPPAPEGVRFTLTNGSVVEGERLATYVHSVFWFEPSSEVTVAVFDPAALAPYPDDRSVTFVRASEVASEAPLEWTATPYRRAMRERGVVIERPPLDGVQFIITGGEDYHLEEDGYGHFALDVVRTDARGLSYEGAGFANDDYYVWDAPVFAPTGGVVVEVVGDAPDRAPGPVDLEAVNNLVGIQLYGGYHLYLLHFRQGSVAVSVGDRVEAGQLLGRVGNSGVSVAPHLHLALLALDPERTPLRTWSVPVEWRDVYVRPSSRGLASLRSYAELSSGSWVSSGAF